MKVRSDGVDLAIMGLFGSKRLSYAQRAERYPTVGMSCPLGQVRDLSATGMRVRSESRPNLKRGESRQFTVGTAAQRLRVTGRAAWVRRVSLRAFEIGIQFMDLTPAQSAALVQLGRYGFVGVPEASGAASPQPGSGASPNAGSKRPDEQARGAPIHAAMEIEDLYATLGVSRGSSETEIRAAYRGLVMKCHPDATTEAGSEAQFAAISKAYSILRDASKRERYDRMLDQAIRAA